MALITTPGSATAESFATVAELDAYAAARLPASAWHAAAVTADKENALRAATRGLDAYFTWTGAAVDGVQALTWPRSGMLSRNGFAIATSGASSIPADLKRAQCEFALQLGDGAATVVGGMGGGTSASDQFITSIKAGPVAVTFADTSATRTTVEGADIAVRFEQSDLNYLDAPAEVRRLLVPSWYVQRSVKRPVLFEAMGGGD